MKYKDYQIQYLDLETKKILFNEAKNKSYSSHVDYLDCKESYARQSSSITPDVMISDYLKESSHCVFIKREDFCGQEDFVEIGFSTMPNLIDNISYYLFLNLKIDDAVEIIDIFKLKPIIKKK